MGRVVVPFLPTQVAVNNFSAFLLAPAKLRDRLADSQMTPDIRGPRLGGWALAMNAPLHLRLVLLTAPAAQ